MTHPLPFQRVDLILPKPTCVAIRISAHLPVSIGHKKRQSTGENSPNREFCGFLAPLLLEVQVGLGYIFIVIYFFDEVAINLVFTT